MPELPIDKMSAHVARIKAAKVRLEQPKWPGAKRLVTLTVDQVDDLIIAGYVAGWADEQTTPDRSKDD